jgi:hypothetical protein
MILNLLFLSFQSLLSHRENKKRVVLAKAIKDREKNELSLIRQAAFAERSRKSKLRFKYGAAIACFP